MPLLPETDRERTERPIFFATTPHFFKIIPDETSRYTKLVITHIYLSFFCQKIADELASYLYVIEHFCLLFLFVQRIPMKFGNNYGKNLSNPVHFKLPSGAEWEIEVTRSDGEVWLDKGWPEFSRVFPSFLSFTPLGYGDCLVFRYEGNSKFHVCIFDTCATEIEYPLPFPEMEEADEDEDESVEILEDFPPCPKTRQKSPLPSPLPHKKKRQALLQVRSSKTKARYG
ncbi:hypothetical protein C1H46_033370 [Malus baccata]|uniref:TF-B3 domain-containing protein n=1 Tax=Malus baccata TaxID=106549 RepID=A0A540L3K2_MALBA|nr:hypothetical protein C1H46_033370 [Malus baccata]